MGRINVTIQIFAGALAPNLSRPHTQHGAKGVANERANLARKPAALTLGNNTMFDTGASSTYLLGLLAMIKCSICSYQCDN